MAAMSLPFFMGAQKRYLLIDNNRITTGGKRHKYTGTEPWATPALRPSGQGDIFYPPSLSGCKRKSSDARGEPSSRRERTALR